MMSKEHSMWSSLGLFLSHICTFSLFILTKVGPGSPSAGASCAVTRLDLCARRELLWHWKRPLLHLCPLRKPTCAKNNARFLTPIFMRSSQGETGCWSESQNIASFTMKYPGSATWHKSSTAARSLLFDSKALILKTGTIRECFVL